MSKNRQQLEAAQEAFNKKYGVNFDIDEFSASIDGLAEIGNIAGADQIYKVTFSKLYKKAFANFVDRKIDGTLDFMEMINEFDKNIIEPYRKECSDEKKPAPKPYGGWKVSDYLKSVGEYFYDVPSIKSLYAEQRYQSGELGMFKMRAFVNGLRQKENVTAGELSTVDCYLSALSSANKNRSPILKILNPVRFIAEKIFMWSFKRYLEQKTGGALDVEKNQSYKEISDIANDNLIVNAKETVGKARDMALQNEQTRAAVQNEKEHVPINASEINGDQVKTVDQIVFEDPQKDNFIDF